MDTLERLVMNAICNIGADSCGSTIRRHVKDYDGKDISSGGANAILYRLEREGLVESIVRVYEGKTKRLYRLTYNGRVVLRHES